MSMFDEEHGFDGPTCKQCGMVNCNSTRGCQRRQHNNKFRRTLDENASLRTQLATVTRERDAKEREIQRLLNVVCDSPACTAAIVRRDDGARICTAGHPARWVNIDLLRTTERERDSWRSQRDEVHAEMERQTQLKREERQAKLDAQRERDEARADAARLREVLQRENMAACKCGDEDYRMSTCPSCRRLAAALASTPSAEPTRTDAERWLSDGPEVPGGTLAFHAAPSAEPTPRDMRVAEAVANSMDEPVRELLEEEECDCSPEWPRCALHRLALRRRSLDLAAVVAKAVKS